MTNNSVIILLFFFFLIFNIINNFFLSFFNLFSFLIHIITKFKIQFLINRRSSSLQFSLLFFFTKKNIGQYIETFRFFFRSLLFFYKDGGVMVMFVLIVVITHPAGHNATVGKFIVFILIGGRRLSCNFILSLFFVHLPADRIQNLLSFIFAGGWNRTFTLFYFW